MGIARNVEEERQPFDAAASRFTPIARFTGRWICTSLPKCRPKQASLLLLFYSLLLPRPQLILACVGKDFRHRRGLLGMGPFAVPAGRLGVLGLDLHERFALTPWRRTRVKYSASLLSVRSSRHGPAACAIDMGTSHKAGKHHPQTVGPALPPRPVHAR